MLSHKKTKVVTYTGQGEKLYLSGPVFTRLVEAVLQKGGLFRFQAKGSSMWPFIKGGDVLTLSRFLKAPPGLGDVVAFCHPERKNLIVHRIIGVNPGGYMIMGDNTSEMDVPVLKKDIIGRVMRIERNKKKIYFGIGPERRLIATFSRTGLLNTIFLPMLRNMQSVTKRVIYG